MSLQYKTIFNICMILIVMKDMNLDKKPLAVGDDFKLKSGQLFSRKYFTNLLKVRFH